MKALVRLVRRITNPRPKSLQERFPQFDIGVGSYGPIQVLRFSDCDSLSIGKYCSFAPDVKIILGGEHRKDWITTYPFSALRPEFAFIQGHPHSKGPVQIGNDVWVGHGATILSGSQINSGAIVGAGAVVAGIIPPYAIAVGNPAVVIGYRFDAETIKELLEIKWWDWSAAEIDGAMELLLSKDVSAFTARFGKLGTTRE